MTNYEITPSHRFHDAQIIELEKRLHSYLKKDLTLIITDNSRSMINAKRRNHVYTIRLHHMFLNADKAVVEAIAHYISGRRGCDNSLLGEFIKKNEQKIKKVPSSPGLRIAKIRVQGEHVNLQDVFEGLNQRYFDNNVKCLITWGAKRKRAGQKSIRLGSYSFRTSTIRIHPVLDKSFVPDYVIDSIVYHEMLHHHLGNLNKDGRHLSHHPAFQKAEKRFSRFHDSKLWIKNNLEKLIR
ncbi:MAG: hypothetical protein JW932_04665 [Deltaproteobacteria bacterium]|nr:hypothetical protein [Deltaproteobacteria bacterium]